MMNETPDQDSIKYDLFKISRELSKETIDKLYNRMEYLKMSPQEQKEYLIKNHLDPLKESLNNIAPSNYQLSEEQKGKIIELEEKIIELEKKINKKKKKVWIFGKAPNILTGDYLLNIQEQCKEDNLNKIIKQATEAGLPEIVANYYMIDSVIPEILIDICNIIDKKKITLSKEPLTEEPLTEEQQDTILELIQELIDFVKLLFNKDKIEIYSKQSEFIGKELNLRFVSNLAIYNLLFAIVGGLNMKVQAIEEDIIELNDSITNIKHSYNILQNKEPQFKLTQNQKKIFQQIQKMFNFLENYITNTINDYCLKEYQKYLRDVPLPPYKEDFPPPSYTEVIAEQSKNFSQNISNSPIGVATSAQGASGIIPNPAEALSSPIGIATSAQGASGIIPNPAEALSSSIGLATSAQGASGIIPNPAEALSSPIEDEVIEKMLAEMPTPPTNSPYNVRRRTNEARQGLKFPPVKF